MPLLRSTINWLLGVHTRPLTRFQTQLLRAPFAERRSGSLALTLEGHRNWPSSCFLDKETPQKSGSEQHRWESQNVLVEAHRKESLLTHSLCLTYFWGGGKPPHKSAGDLGSLPAILRQPRQMLHPRKCSSSDPVVLGNCQDHPSRVQGAMQYREFKFRPLLHAKYIPLDCWTLSLQYFYEGPSQWLWANVSN